MILREIRTYLQNRKQASLNEMAIHFDVEPDALKGMLEFWVNRGIISHHATTHFCAGSCSCNQRDQNDLYSWNPQLAKIPIKTR